MEAVDRALTRHLHRSISSTMNNRRWYRRNDSLNVILILITILGTIDNILSSFERVLSKLAEQMKQGRWKFKTERKIITGYTRLIPLLLLLFNICISYYLYWIIVLIYATIFHYCYFN